MIGKKFREATKNTKGTKKSRVAGGTREERGRASTRTGRKPIWGQEGAWRAFVYSNVSDAASRLSNDWKSGRDVYIENNENRFADIERREGKRMGCRDANIASWKLALRHGEAPTTPKHAKTGGWEVWACG